MLWELTLIFTLWKRHAAPHSKLELKFSHYSPVDVSRQRYVFELADCVDADTSHYKRREHRPARGDVDGLEEGQPGCGAEECAPRGDVVDEVARDGAQYDARQISEPEETDLESAGVRLAARK